MKTRRHHPLPPEKSLALIHQFLSNAMAETSSWRDDGLGTDLAYLCEAIADRKRGAYVDWSRQYRSDGLEKTYRQFRRWFPRRPSSGSSSGRDLKGSPAVPRLRWPQGSRGAGHVQDTLTGECFLGRRSRNDGVPFFPIWGKTHFSPFGESLEKRLAETQFQPPENYVSQIGPCRFSGCVIPENPSKKCGSSARLGAGTKRESVFLASSCHEKCDRMHFRSSCVYCRSVAPILMSVICRALPICSGCNLLFMCGFDSRRPHHVCAAATDRADRSGRSRLPAAKLTAAPSSAAQLPRAKG